MKKLSFLLFIFYSSLSYSSILTKPRVNVGLLNLPENKAVGIQLTKIPTEFYTKGDTTEWCTIAWTPGGINGRMEYGIYPGGGVSGNYSNTLSVTGTDSIRFSPGKEGFDTGIYYCIISNVDSSAQVSIEFMLVVESDIAPAMIRPEGTVDPDTLIPLFEWSPVTNVPYYMIIVSDMPFRIYEDSLGDKHIAGISAVWEAITPNTGIDYGVADPSGYFDNSNAPPLMDGIEYNWLVLNNYGNSPNTTSEVMPVAPKSFFANMGSPLAAPFLISPPQDDSISGPTVSFLWRDVSGATNYKVYLYFTVEEEGDSISYLIWEGVTTDTTIDLTASSFLIDSKYTWRVVASDDADNNTASSIRNFFYLTSIGQLKIETNSMGEDLPLVHYFVRDGGTTSIPYSTDGDGNASIPCLPDSYSVEFFKEGYADTTFEDVVITANDTTELTVDMRLLDNFFYGEVVDSSNGGVPMRQNATVHFLKWGEEKTIVTDPYGNFRKALCSDTMDGWKIWATSPGYLPSDTIIDTLNPDDNINLGTIALYELTSSIKVWTEDSATGTPIKDVYITVQNNGTLLDGYTDNNGFIEIPVSPDTWVVKASKILYYLRPDSFVVAVALGEHKERTFQLVKSGLLLGNVTDSIHGSGLDSAFIEAVPISGGSYASTYTDGNGDYSLDVWADSYWVKVSKPNFLPDSISISITAGETQTHDFALLPYLSYIVGTVSDTADSPLTNVLVKILNGGPGDTTRTDGLGRYYFEVTPESLWTLDAFLAGFASDGPKSTTIPVNQTDTLDFTLTPDAGSVLGWVKDSLTQSPIEGAQVFAYSSTDTSWRYTDSLGFYSFNLESGDWVFHAELSGYLPSLPESVTVSVGIVDTVNFSLLFNISYVRGWVYDSVWGDSLTDVLIDAIPDSGGNYDSTRTDPWGEYSLSVVPGRYWLFASKDGFVRDSVQFTNTVLDTFNYDFALIPNIGWITGSVKDTTDSALVSVLVRVLNGFPSDSAITDSLGSYFIEIAAGSTWVLDAFKPGWSSDGAKSTFVALGDTDTVNFVMTPGAGSVLGWVKDSLTSDPIEGARVSACDGDTTLRLTDSLGLYSFNLSPGVWELRASAAGWLTSPQESVTVSSGSVNTVNFSLVPVKGVIRGYCMDQDGDSLENVLIIANGLFTDSTNSSGFYSLSLYPDDYTITATKSGYSTQQIDTSLNAGDTLEIDFILQKNAVLYGWVHTPDNDGIPGVEVNAVALDPRFGKDTTTTTDTTGWFTLPLQLLGTDTVYYHISTKKLRYRALPPSSYIMNFAPGEVDTIYFTLEYQLVDSLVIEPRDAVLVDNLSDHQYYVVAYDSLGCTVDIEPVLWDITFKDTSGSFSPDSNGFLIPDSCYFGEITIFATDTATGVRVSKPLEIFAPVYPATDKTLHDETGFKLKIVPNAVSEYQELRLHKRVLPDAKKVTKTYEIYAVESYHILPKDLGFETEPVLTLPLPIDAPVSTPYVGRWNLEEVDWDILTQSNRDIPGVVSSNINRLGEYTVISYAPPLSILNLELVPNPFSPKVRDGLGIKFSLTSNTSRSPTITIKFYNMVGELVRTLVNSQPRNKGLVEETWDGLTNHNKLARNGRYVIQIIAEDGADRVEIIKSVVLIK